MAEAGRKARCTFCSSEESIEQEHIFANWLRKQLPKMTLDYDRLHVDSTGKHELHRDPGSLISRKHRNVCYACNHGWMWSLENEVAPVVKRVLASETTTITIGETALLAAWFA